jgi:hypothetical protein
LGLFVLARYDGYYFVLRFFQLCEGLLPSQQGALWLFGVSGNGTDKDLKEKI